MTTVLAQQSIGAEALAWFRGEPFRAIPGIPQLIVEHLLLSAASLALAIALALPLALWLGHRGWLPVASVNAANAFRAIPAFGLLLVTFQLGGFSTLLLVLVFALIGIAPIFANAYIGIRGVDPDIVDAARGMGLTSRQVLLTVELPLATPVVMAGIRTAAVNIVATVTLAAVVSFGGLGLPIVSGLSRGVQFSDSARVLAIGGAVMVALVSIAAEVGLGRLQRLLTPRGLRLRDGDEEHAVDPADQAVATTGQPA